MSHKMNKEAKEKWVKALRSGKYKQDRGALCRINNEGKKGFCCLGVLIDTESKGTWMPGSHLSFYFKDESGLMHAGMPHEKFTSDLGLLHSFAQKLASMNDDGKSFEEIADFIEENL